MAASELSSAARLELLAEGARRLGLSLEDDALQRLELYFRELLKWHRRVNLVARAPEPELLELHFLDSLTILPLCRFEPPPADSPVVTDHEVRLPPVAPSPARTAAGLPETAGSAKDASSLLDIGSGAGFPGLVLKCCRPELALTLLEPRQKRVAFLRQVLRVTGLKAGCEVLAQRLVPGGGAQAQRRWPLITGRAVASVADFLDLCAPLSPPGGRVICMKGRRAAAEVEQWHRLKRPGEYRLDQEKEVHLPFSGVLRRLLIFVKEQPAE